MDGVWILDSLKLSINVFRSALTPVMPDFKLLTIDACSSTLYCIFCIAVSNMLNFHAKLFIVRSSKWYWNQNHLYYTTDIMTTSLFDCSKVICFILLRLQKLVFLLHLYTVLERMEIIWKYFQLILNIIYLYEKLTWNWFRLLYIIQVFLWHKPIISRFCVEKLLILRVIILLI